MKLTIGRTDRAAAERDARDHGGPTPSPGDRAWVEPWPWSGPAPAFVPRRADRWRWNVVLRGDDPAALLDGDVPAPWSVDVDPESLL